jgi:gliding motility-associated-like protein
VLYVLGNGIAYLEFYVYDRHGKIVFESNSQEHGWDGTFEGDKVEAGAYVYFAKITYESGFQEILKGDVTLVR